MIKDGDTYYVFYTGGARGGGGRRGGGRRGGRGAAKCRGDRAKPVVAASKAPRKGPLRNLPAASKAPLPSRPVVSRLLRNQLAINRRPRKELPGKPPADNRLPPARHPRARSTCSPRPT